MGEGALPIVGRLVGALYRSCEGRPAIVVGGGPSAPEQYARVVNAVGNPVIVSANHHASKLGLQPDFIVCKDHTHTETKERMEDVLRPLGAPIIARHYWADYRLCQWPLQGNSGQMALGVALLLGCRPVIPVGFDCYMNGTYFHDLSAPNVSHGFRPSMWSMRYKRFSNKLELAPVRPLAGPLVEAFPRFDPAERFDRPHMPVVLQRYANMTEHFAHSKVAFPSKHDPLVEVPAGRVFPIDDIEAQAYRQAGWIDLVDSPWRSMKKSPAQATAAEGSTPSP